MSKNNNKLVVLITGANQGLGFQAAKQLVATGKYTVIIGSRSEAKGQQAIRDIVQAHPSAHDSLDTVPLDITSDDSIAAAARAVDEKYGRLDGLVNNAALGDFELANRREKYARMFDTNVFGQIECTEAFLPLLRKSDAGRGGRRIVFVSSGLGSLSIASAPNSPFPGRLFPSYRMSKAALNMAVVHFASLLEPEGFTVAAVCPGHCNTGMNNHEGTKPPEDGARVIPLAVESAREEVHNRFVHYENAQKGEYPW